MLLPQRDGENLAETKYKAVVDVDVGSFEAKMEQAAKTVDVLGEALEMAGEASPFEGVISAAAIAQAKIDMINKELKENLDAQAYFAAQIANGDFSQETIDNLSAVTHSVVALQAYREEAVNGLQEAKNIVDGIDNSSAVIGEKVAGAFERVRDAAKTASGFIGKLRDGIAKVMSAARSANRATSTGMKQNLMTILKYTVGIRSLYILFNRLRRAASDGIGGLSKHSKTLNSALSSMNSALTQLKGSIGTAFAPPIETVAPYITRFISLLADGFNAIGAFTAALTGQSTYKKAVYNYQAIGDAAKSSADSTNKAKDAADEYKKTLAGFDEITKLNEQNSSSGGSGSGSGGSGKTDAFGFVDESIPNVVGDFADKVKEAWANADFTEIGTIVGTKLKNALESINWTGIQATCEKVAKSTATFLNGFFETNGLDTAVGNTVGNLIVTGLKTAETSAKTFHFDSLGTFVANGINAAVKTIKQSDVNFGSTIASLVSGAISGLGSFASNVKWSEVGSFISDNINSFSTGINWRNAGAAANNLIGGFADMLTSAIENIDTKEVADAITEFFKGLDPVDLTIKIGKLLFTTGGKLFEAGEELWESIGFGTALGDTAVDVQLNTTANMVGVKDSLTDSQKSFKTKSIFDTAKDGLSSTEKTFGSTAKFTGRSDKLTAAQKTISGMTAGFTGKNTTNLNKNIPGMTAVITSKSNSLSTNQKKLTGFTAVISGVKAASKKIAEWFGIKMAAGGGIYKNGRWHNPTQYAAGTPALGAPNTGELFWARESGPELVGRIGTSTAVLNNAQIVDSVSDGVYRAVKAANSGDNQSKTPIVVQLVLDGKVVGQTAVDYINGKARTTGINPLSAYI